jgi:hypothetical protein
MDLIHFFPIVFGGIHFTYPTSTKYRKVNGYVCPVPQSPVSVEGPIGLYNGVPDLILHNDICSCQLISFVFIIVSPKPCAWPWEFAVGGVRPRVGPKII